MTVAATNISLPISGNQSASEKGNLVPFVDVLKSRFDQIARLGGQALLTHTVCPASRFELRAFAEARIAGLMAAGRFRSTAASRRRATEVLDLMLTVNGPTPQVGAAADSSLEIHWLSGGVFVGAIIESDGYVMMSCEPNVDGEEIDIEFEPNQPLASSALVELQDVVKRMSDTVARRPLDWPAGRSVQ